MAFSFTFKKSSNLFSDFAKLERAIGKESAKALRRVGAQLRTRIKRKVRRSNQTSKPGDSPFAHAPGNSGLRAVEFVLESNYNLVVGAIKYGRQLQDRTAPNIHEFGGQVHALNEQDQKVIFVKRRGRRVPFVNGKAITPQLPPNVRQNSRGLLVDKRTGRILTKADAIRVRKQSMQNAMGIARRIGRTRRYPKRPVAAPVLAIAIAQGVIPSYFKNILRGL